MTFCGRELKIETVRLVREPGVAVTQIAGDLKLRYMSRMEFEARNKLGGVFKWYWRR